MQTAQIRTFCIALIFTPMLVLAAWSGWPMKHVETISALIKTLLESERFHALVVQSPPGWAKSTTIDQALGRMGRPFVAQGAYSTPLHIYNTFCEHPDSIHVLDDCAGLFNDVRAMSILKAATWTSSGSSVGDETEPAVISSARRIAWGSTSDKVAEPSVDFRGKIILLSNTLPAGQETQAFLSRCLSYRITFTENQIKELLLAASQSREHFTDSATAEVVAAFLVSDFASADLMQLSLRTLQMGYDLAKSNPEMWRDLLLDLLPKKQRHDLVAQLVSSNLPVKVQEARFRALTGKSRRTFYEYKKKLGLSRPYRVKLDI